MLFIVIHQVYELWFKEILHEIDRVKRLLDADEAHRPQHTLKRILTILKVLVAQLDILETMTPLEFMSFRARLEAASGFQSDQFRQLEFTLGRKSRQAIQRFAAGSRAHTALEQRFAEPTLWDAFLRYLAREGYSGAEADADARRHGGGPAVRGGAAGAHRHLSHGPQELRDLRAARRSR
jgi:tryptophan 2,3-dioxygenase